MIQKVKNIYLILTITFTHPWPMPKTNRANELLPFHPGFPYFAVNAVTLWEIRCPFSKTILITEITYLVSCPKDLRFPYHCTVAIKLMSVATTIKSLKSLGDFFSFIKTDEESCNSLHTEERGFLIVTITTNI